MRPTSTCRNVGHRGVRSASGQTHLGLWSGFRTRCRARNPSLLLLMDHANVACLGLVAFDLQSEADLHASVKLRKQRTSEAWGEEDMFPIMRLGTVDESILGTSSQYCTDEHSLVLLAVGHHPRVSALRRSNHRTSCWPKTQAS